jgi:hypothetical protein
MTIYTWRGVSVSRKKGKIRVVANDKNTLTRNNQLVGGGTVARVAEKKPDYIDLDWIAMELNNHACCRDVDYSTVLDAILCVVKLPSSLVHSAGALLLWKAELDLSAGDPKDHVIPSHWVAKITDEGISDQVLAINATEDMQFSNQAFMMG